ncbi:MAG: septum site-determining protein MinC [Anaerolineales bacterium]
MGLSVEFKGISEGLLVTWEGSESEEMFPADWLSAEHALFAEIDQRGDFLKGAKLILDVEDYEIGAAAMGRLRDIIAEKGLSLWGVLSRSLLTQQSAQAMGLATKIHEAGDDDEIAAEEYEEDTVEPGYTEGGAAFIIRTLRSGSSITHNGHVTLIGDVNPGAEIIAAGSVLVWGRLRGLVHAGSDGDESAIICALELSPTQLRIGNHVTVPPAERGPAGPEIALVRDGQVVAEPWEPQLQLELDLG